MKERGFAGAAVVALVFAAALLPGPAYSAPTAVAVSKKTTAKAAVQIPAKNQSSRARYGKAKTTTAAPARTRRVKAAKKSTKSVSRTKVASAVTAPDPVSSRLLRERLERMDKEASLSTTEGLPASLHKLPDSAPDMHPPQIASRYLPSGFPVLSKIEGLDQFGVSRNYELDQLGNRIYFTPVPSLQRYAKKLLAEYRVPWGALVAVEPKTGKVLALAGRSEQGQENIGLTTRATFPAASLFKLITASAGVEKSGLTGDTVLTYRGGKYTLNRSNYFPDVRRDRNRISLASALGSSCNPAFARVALNSLSYRTLEQYANSFGFNRTIPFEAPLQRSSFYLPHDEYEFARTAAGFGEVLLSPLHAAMVAASLANDGVMMQPYVIDRIVDRAGTTKYQAHPAALQRTVMKSTARQVLEMMHETVISGTARKHFGRSSCPALKQMRIGGKTGTLKGTDPQGVYHWFVAAAPLENPELAIAALVIDPGNARINGTGLGRRFMEYFFGGQEDPAPPQQRLAKRVKRPARS